MRKRGVILLLLVLLLFGVLVYAQTYSEKVVLNNADKSNFAGSLISTENFNVGDIFYLEDGRKAKVTGIKDIVSDSDSNFDNQNFFANGVLVHNKDPVLDHVIAITTQERALQKIKIELIEGLSEREFIQEWRLFMEEGGKKGIVFKWGGTGGGTVETRRIMNFLYGGDMLPSQHRIVSCAIDSNPAFGYYLATKFPELRRTLPALRNPELKYILDFMDDFTKRNDVQTIKGIFHD